jgi:hypothetical protein
MTGLTRPNFPRIGNVGKTNPWQTASAVCHDRNVCSLLAENVDFAVIKTHLSLGFRWNA